jgi:hypothetical protein
MDAASVEGKLTITDTYDAINNWFGVIVEEREEVRGKLIIEFKVVATVSPTVKFYAGTAIAKLYEDSAHGLLRNNKLFNNVHDLRARKYKMRLSVNLIQSLNIISTFDSRKIELATRPHS